jgi:hypothetical protein
MSTNHEGRKMLTKCQKWHIRKKPQAWNTARDRRKAEEAHTSASKKEVRN